MKKKYLSTAIAISMIAHIPAFSLPQSVKFASFSPASYSVFSTPQSLGLPINTTDNDNAPFLAPNGLSLYFSGNGVTGQGGGDISVSKRQTISSPWGIPQNLGGVINTAGLENSPSLSPDGKILFFHSSRPDGLGGQDIYMSTRTDISDDLSWSAPVNLTAINSTSDDLTPGYYEDQVNGTRLLFFVSDRAGGAGGRDIYQSVHNQNGTFSTPVIVTELNTPSLEARPQIRRDGLEIFLASDRSGGLGDIDIWVSTRATTSSPWNQPVNVAMINSSSTDFTPSISADGSVLYFSSFRDGGLGGHDIYLATRASVNRNPSADFDGDGRSDLSVFRPTDGTWWSIRSSDNTVDVRQFGQNGDKIVPGDYDGDGRIDAAVFRPTSGNWYVLRSSDGEWSATNLGITTDKPVPGDYDGDGRTDMAIYRNGTWYIKQSSTGNPSYQQFGLSTDIPIAGVSQ